MTVDLKTIIDEHYKDFYKRYRKICYDVYNGHFLYEDLLHELYFGFLSVRPDIISSFHSQGKLENIGFNLIKFIYGNRNKKKRRGDSALLEIKNIEYININYEYKNDPFYNIGVEDDNIKEIEYGQDFEDRTERRKHERKLDTLNSLITANRDNEKVQLLIMCNNKTVVDVSKETGLSKYMIRKELIEIKETLKQHIA